MVQTARQPRLDGIDLARFIAFAGMVVVNFAVVMVHDEREGDLGWLAEALSGKAAATFVVLAGIGITLSRMTGWALVYRSAFLMVIGLINSLIFPADIIHYYAVYFLVAVMLVGRSSRALYLGAVAVTVLAALSILLLNYDAGWNWDTLEYVDFWTVTGAVRNLFYNGWHPVFPWIGLLMIGLAIGRLDLTAARVRSHLMWCGFALLALAYVSAMTLRWLLDAPELVPVLHVGPIPPMPFFMAAGTGTALIVLASAVWLTEAFPRITRPLAIAGRQSLTLYLAHIAIGMGAMEALGLIGGGSASLALWWSFGFCILAAIAANLWHLRFRHGPLESLMRAVTSSSNRGQTGRSIP